MIATRSPKFSVAQWLTNRGRTPPNDSKSSSAYTSVSSLNLPRRVEENMRTRVLLYSFTLQPRGRELSVILHALVTGIFVTFLRKCLTAGTFTVQCSQVDFKASCCWSQIRLTYCFMSDNNNRNVPRKHLSTDVLTGSFRCIADWRNVRNVRRESEKQDTLLLPITLPNVDRFSKFCHHRTQQ